MAKKIKIPNKVVERNIRLTGEIMNYLLNHPQVFGALPDKFELVILPDDDPEMRLYNLDLLDKHSSGGNPLFLRGSVRAQRKFQKEVSQVCLCPPQYSCFGRSTIFCNAN